MGRALSKIRSPRQSLALKHGRDYRATHPILYELSTTGILACLRLAKKHAQR